MAIAKRIAFNVFYNSVAKILSTALALVGIGFVTRYLGKEGFGDYATVLAFFAFFASIADLGLYSITTREISREKADEHKIVSSAFSFRLLISGIVFLASPIIAWLLPYSPEIKTGIIIAAGAFIFSSAYGLLNGVFQKHIAMNRVATAELIGKVIQVGIISLVVSKNLGFTAILLAFFFSTLANFIIVFLQSRRYVRIRLVYDPAQWKIILEESLPMGVAVFVTFLYFKMDTILLSVLRGSSEVGIYGVAYKVIENLTFFPGMVIGLVFPLFSRYLLTDRQKFSEVADKIFKIFFILVVPLIIGGIYLAQEIIDAIGGHGFPEAVNVLRVLILALGWIFFGNFFNNILIAGNLQKKMMLVLAVCASFNITANLIFIPAFSYQGAAAVSMLTEMLVTLSTFFIAKKYLNYSPNTDSIPKIIFSGFVMLTLFWLLSPLVNIFMVAGLATLTYFLLLWLTKTITNDELRLIFSRRNPDPSDIIAQ